MLSLLDPRMWLVVVALMAAAYGSGRWQQWRADDQSAQAARLQATEAAREQEAKWQTNVEALSDVHQTEIQRIAADRDRAVRELRNRPERMPEASRSACQGGTGAELSSRDSEFLEGLAARADGLRAALAECQGWIDAAKHPEGVKP